MTVNWQGMKNYGQTLAVRQIFPAEQTLAVKQTLAVQQTLAVEQTLPIGQTLPAGQWGKPAEVILSVKLALCRACGGFDCKE